MSYYDKAYHHPIAGRWHRNIIRMVQSLLPEGWLGMSHCDVGCGDGVTIREIKPHGPITGLDVDDEMLVHAERRGIRTIKANAQEPLPLGGEESVSMVTCLDVLEHLEHPTLALQEIYRVLKRPGFLIITTPNETWLFKLIWKMWTTFGMGKFWSRAPHLFAYNLWNSTSTGMSLIERLRDVGFHPEKTAKTNFGMVAGVRAVKL